MELDFEQKYIYYVQWEDSLPPLYLYLSRFFSEKGIQLIPVKPEEMLGLVSYHKQFAIAVVWNLQSLKSFKRLRHKGLDYSLQLRKLSLYHVSSFPPLETIGKLKSMQCYEYFEMPIEARMLAQKIYDNYTQNYREKELWPGGRRAKLPSDGVKE